MGPSKRKGSTRRPVLDLNAREDSPSRPTWQTKYQHVLSEEDSHQNGDSQTPPPAQSNPLSGLLGNYNSDSDSEDPPPSSKSNLDAKVEDFLKEIRSISAKTINVQKDVAPEPKEKEPPLYPASVTAWQQCYDHNSGYPYYWNTVTNEVTWEMPAELKTAIANVAAKQQKVSLQKSQPQPEEKTKPVKKKVSKYPWQTESDSEDEKIEMITSFGPPSDEESNEEVKKVTKKEKKSAPTIGPNLPVKTLTKISDISPAPEDLEGMNETTYETSSLLTHSVPDTGPPGDDAFQLQKEAIKTAKVPESSTKDSSISGKSDNLKTESIIKSPLAKSVVENVVNVQETKKIAEPIPSDPVSLKMDTNIADDVIAQIEKETPPDYEVAKPKTESHKPDDSVSNADSHNSTNSKTSSFALIANYGDDSESEDSNVMVKRKSTPKIRDAPKPLFPIDIPEEKVKPLFPCMNAEPSKLIMDIQPKELPQEEPEPVGNIYNMELDDPAAQKAFKRKKRIEFATTIYSPSTSKAKPVEQAVTVPTTQYNLDPNSNEHRGFGFDALRSQPDMEKKSYKNYGGIQFIKAETLNLNPEPPKDKSEIESDTSAPKDSAKEPVKDEEIEDAASLLKEKLIFLVGGKEDISPVQLMAIELETLVSAWQQGALTPPYLMRWLKEKCGEIIQHEKTAAPTGWTCLWDRKTKRYYYRNATTKAIQWEYPTVEEKPKTKESESCGDEMDICDTPPHLSPARPEKQTDEPPSTPPPPVISDATEKASPPSPTPQPPPPPQISFCSENESSAPKASKKMKREAEETNSEGETEELTTPTINQSSDSSEAAAPPLPPMPPPPPPPPDESPPPLPDSPPPLPLEPDQPLPPGVDEPEYAVYRVSKHSYKKAQDSAAYSTELMMTYGYGLPVQQVVSSGAPAMTMPIQPMDYHTYMHEAVSNPYIVQSAATSHVIHCPAKKPKPSLTSELVSFYSDIAMLDSSPAENSVPQTAPSKPTPPQEPPRNPSPPPPVVVTTSHSSVSAVSGSSSSKSSESVTSNGINAKKKKKIKTATTKLSLKKKGVSSLVAKWQQVQEEVRRDFSDDDDDVSSSK